MSIQEFKEKFNQCEYLTLLSFPDFPKDIKSLKEGLKVDILNFHFVDSSQAYNTLIKYDFTLNKSVKFAIKRGIPYEDLNVYILASLYIREKMFQSLDNIFN